MEMIAVYILAVLYGACVGSFLNVVIYRLPNGMNLAKPASHCTKCGYKLKWYDNIPVISYIILGGKCRCCHEHISFRYTFVEVLNTVLWVLAVALFWKQSILTAIAVAIAASILLCIACIDFEMMYMHDYLTYSLAAPIILMVISSFINKDGATWIERLIGAGGYFLIFLTIYLTTKYLVRKEGLGLGDVLFVLFVGALLGWKKSIMSLGIATIAGSLVLLPLELISNSKQKKEKTQSAAELPADISEDINEDINDENINEEENEEDEEAADGSKKYPFGPFLVFGAMIAMYFGDKIIDWYLSLLAI